MAITLEAELSRPAISPAPVIRKAVDALARSRTARAAADALIYLFVATACAIFAAIFLTIVADQACAPAYVLTEISNYLCILALLLLTPAVVLFFLRAAGCSTTKAAAGDGESVVVKDDVEEPPFSFSENILSPLPFLFIGATSMRIISFVFYMYGYSEISELFGDTAILCIFHFLCEGLFYLCEALFYLCTGAVWRWRMNPKHSNTVAAE